MTCINVDTQLLPDRTSKVCTMPKTRAGEALTWDTCPPPQTPLQREAFLNLCTDWLAKQTGDEVPAVFSARTAPVSPLPDPPEGTSELFARSRTEIRIRSERETCVFCGAPGARLAMANPFSHRHLVLACSACKASA